MTIIEWMNQLLIHKKSWDSFSEVDQKSFSSYIINRWLSMDEEFIEVVNYFQKYSIGTLEPREVYRWYSNFLPSGKRFNKYIKSKKIKKIDPEIINILCDYFEDSKSNIIEYIDSMNKKQLKEILKMYGRDK